MILQEFLALTNAESKVHTGCTSCISNAQSGGMMPGTMDGSLDVEQALVGLSVGQRSYAVSLDLKLLNHLTNNLMLPISLS